MRENSATITTTTSTTVTVDRRELPPVPVPDGVTPINQSDTYATVECGALRAEVVRYSGWDPGESCCPPDGYQIRVSFDVRITGFREDGGGHAEIYATEPNELADLTEIALQAARLLVEARLS